MPRKSYPTDLTDKQWELLEPLIPASKWGGRPREVDIREVVNALLYVNRTGCQWEFLPHDFPPHGTVYWYFQQWRDDGTWEQIHDTLREQVRRAAGRDPGPSAGSWIARVSRPPKSVARAATTPPRTSRGASGTSSSTRWACCGGWW